MIRGVIFDMDGVLVDNAAYHIDAFEIFCAHYGVLNWRQKLSSAFGMGNDDIMSLIMPEDVICAKGFAALSEEKEAIYRDIYAPYIRPIEGLVEFLDKLRAEGIRCAVGSSACKRNVDFVLEKCGIASYFDAQVSEEDVTRCKPNPDIYLTAAAKLGLEPEECLVFEDAKTGILAAQNAGIGRIVALATTCMVEALIDEEVDAIIPDFRWILCEKRFQILLND